MFEELDALNHRPAPFSRTTTRELWTDEHVSAQMLALHLDPDSGLASRSPKIEGICAWARACVTSAALAQYTLEGPPIATMCSRPPSCTPTSSSASTST